MQISEQNRVSLLSICKNTQLLIMPINKTQSKLESVQF